jgi:hypothetical protein
MSGVNGQPRKAHFERPKSLFLAPRKPTFAA